METGKWIGYGDVTIDKDLPDRGKHSSWTRQSIFTSTCCVCGSAVLSCLHVNCVARPELFLL
jgi:hypothetical protein